MSRYVRNPPTPEQVRAERQRAKASIPAAASLVGVSPMTWERYEAGQTRMHPAHLELFRIKSMLLHQTAAHAAKKVREQRTMSAQAPVLSSAAVLRELVAAVPRNVRYSQEFSARFQSALAQLAHFDQVLNGREPPPLILTASPSPPTTEQETDDDEPRERQSAAGA